MIRSYCAMMIRWCIACSLVAFSIGNAKADIIWQAPVTISSDLDVSTAGDLIRAWSVVNAFNTINGVTFSRSFGGNEPQGQFLISGPDFGVGSNIYNNLSDPYKSLLNTAVYRATNKPADAIMTINLHSLIVDRVYEFQAFVNDSRDIGNFGRFNVFDSGVGSPQSQRVFQPLNSGNTNIGQHIKGTFTAAASGTQEVRILGGSLTGQNVSLINAYQLRDITAVPEPSSILLLSSAAGLGGMFMRKRLRKVIGK